LSDHQSVEGPDGPAPTVARAIFTELAQTNSRRGFLAGIFRLTLSAVGVSTVYQIVAPAQRALADSNCTQCQLCGMCGYPCDACGGSLSSCPSGSSQGSSSWSACCFCGSCQTYRYYDCCASEGPCPVTKCTQGCNTQAWCAGSGFAAYYCSLAIASGGCGPC
jgi:methylamine dehydrogenase light chain